MPRDDIRTKKTNTALIVVVCVVAGLFLACSGIASMSILVWTAAQTGPSNTPPVTKKTYTRDEFRSLVVGKTPDEVVKMLGRPSLTKENGVWVYYDVSVDPISGKTDLATWLTFEDGVVESVSY